MRERAEIILSKTKTQLTRTIITITRRKRITSSSLLSSSSRIKSSTAHNLSCIRFLSIAILIGTQFLVICSLHCVSATTATTRSTGNHITSYPAVAAATHRFQFDVSQSIPKGSQQHHSIPKTAAMASTTTFSTSLPSASATRALFSSTSSSAWSPSSSATAVLLPLTYTPSLKTTSMSTIAPAHNIVHQSAKQIIKDEDSMQRSTASDAFTAIDQNVHSQMRDSYSNSLGISDVGSSTMPESISTVSSYVKPLKATSKFPMDFTFTRNFWTHSDASVASSASVTVELDRPRIYRTNNSGKNIGIFGSSISGGGVSSSSGTKHHHEHHWGPFFENSQLNSTASSDNVVTKVHLYTEAVLNCRVGMLKDKTVMWVRRTTEKVSLLTVGNVTYSGDPRIRVKFQYPNNWRLLINPTQREDAGVYMCQVSTHPPRVFTTNLTILEPPLRLIDDQEREMGDRYYKAGSTIDLQCQISRSFLLKEMVSIMKSVQVYNQIQQQPHTPKANRTKIVDIQQNERTIANNDSAKHQVQNIETQFSNFIYVTKDDDVLPPSVVKRTSITDKWLNIRVSIPEAKLTDSGNYSCSIGRLFSTIVQVQVLTGELPAAVQHNTAIAIKAPTIIRQTIITTTITYTLHLLLRTIAAHSWRWYDLSVVQLLFMSIEAIIALSIRVSYLLSHGLTIK